MKLCGALVEEQCTYPWWHKRLQHSSSHGVISQMKVWVYGHSGYIGRDGVIDLRIPLVPPVIWGLHLDRVRGHRQYFHVWECRSDGLRPRVRLQSVVMASRPARCVLPGS
jgi:hypothetical protein